MRVVGPSRVPGTRAASPYDAGGTSRWAMSRTAAMIPVTVRTWFHRTHAPAKASNVPAPRRGGR